MKSPIQARNGFSLVEVTLALGVAAISFVAIFGLLPIGLQTDRDANEQIAAINISSAVIADLRATPGTGAANSPQFGISIPGPGLNSNPPPLYFSTEGTFSNALAADSRYRVTITFTSNSAGLRAATWSDIRVAWPAAANPLSPSGAADMFVALDRN